MPNLQADQDIIIELDFKENVIKITDINGYDPGIGEDVTGIFSITQPDGITVDGDWNAPEIYWDSGAFVVAERPLRLTTGNQPQEGTYTVEYSIDHPGYSPSVITKTFTLSYSRKTLVIVKDFDIFTPSLFYRDQTSFAQAGFDIDTNTVAWEAVIATIGTVNGAASDFDLAYSGQYYTGSYATSYVRDILYSHQSYNYLTVRDRYIRTLTATVLAPPAINDIIGCLDDLYNTLTGSTGDCGCDSDCDCCEEKECKFLRAMARYSLLFHKLRIGDTEGVQDIFDELLSLTGCTWTSGVAVVLDPYDLGNPASSAEDWYYYTVGADVTEVTLVAMNNKVINAIDLDGIGRKFTNGADGDTPASGEFVVVTGSTPRKFKYGGTLYTGNWLRIKYRTL